MNIFNKSQKGEITTLMVLLGIGIMAVGIIAGKKLVEVGTRFLPKAQETENQVLAGGIGLGTYEENYQGITYDPPGAWERVFNKDAIGNNYFQRSNTPLSTATFKVNGGDRLDLYLRRSGSAGKVGIYIDGILQPIEDLYVSSNADFAKFSYDYSSGKNNNIKIEVRQNKNVNSLDYNVGLNYFVVRFNPTPTPTVTLTPTPTVTLTPTLTPTVTPTPVSGSGTGLTGEYFDNSDLTNLKLTRTDATVNFNWVYGSPDPSIAVETFSVRWTGQVQPRHTQTYTFYTYTDDGVRLWVNNQLLIDKWAIQSAEWSGTIALIAGQKYDIKVEYFENLGGTFSKLSWSSASQAKEIIPQSQLYPANTSPTLTMTPTPTVTLTPTPTVTLTPTLTPTVTPTPVSGSGTGLTGEYYDNMDLTNLKLARIDPTVNFNWGSGSPDLSSIASDTFSVRWTGQVQPRYTEIYTFWTTTDDGVRLWVNNQLLIDKWVNQPGNEWSGTITLVAGQKYDIKMEYFENGGGAQATLSWSSASQAKEIIPQSQLYPVGGTTPTPTPTITSTPTPTTTPSTTPTPTVTLTPTPTPTGPTLTPSSTPFPSPTSNPVTVGFWAFDEGSGNTVADSSGNGNNGTWSGTGNHWVDGRNGKAGNFNGTDDYVSLPARSTNFTGATITLWANPTAVKNWARFIDFGNGHPNNNILFARNGTSSGLTFEVYNGTTSGGKVTADNAIELNQWQHFAGTVDSTGAVKIYKNGILIKTGTTAVPQNITRNNNYIGKSNWSGDGLFQGSVDDIHFYNYARTPEQIMSDMTSACPSGDLGNLNCDQGGLRDETDLSILLANWRPTGSCTSAIPTPTPLPNLRDADITGDCKVDESDLSKLLANWKTQ